MIFFKPILLTTICVLVFNCQQNRGIEITVKNPLNSERTFETVSIHKSKLKGLDINSVIITDLETNTIITSQLVDNDGDGTFDNILFQPKLLANAEKKYRIDFSKHPLKKDTTQFCYSRFVPERTDDYTWENNKVAFRVYGPTAQKMIEDNISGGTLSSGVDAWLKRVEYPIINKWYNETTTGTGSYHEDTGEGLDNFHVGISRGVGGIAVKVDTSYYYSKNFTKWRTITTGPIRTSFYLEYKNWDANGKTITESKIISLDYGQYLSKFKTTVKGTNTISAGLTLHEKDGIVTGNAKEGWLCYWQPHAKSKLGTAIIAAPKYFKNFETYNTTQKDLSNAYAHLNVINNTVIYYAGFGWKKQGVFKNETEWKAYLKQFSEKINNPLQVSF